MSKRKRLKTIKPVPSEEYRRMVFDRRKVLREQYRDDSFDAIALREVIDRFKGNNGLSQNSVDRLTEYLLIAVDDIFETFWEVYSDYEEN